MQPLRFVFLLCTAACSAGDPRASVPVTAPTAPEPRRTITINGDLTGLFPGVRLRLQVGAVDPQGRPVSTESAQLTLNDPTIATVVAIPSVPVTYAQHGISTRALMPELVMLAPGTTRLRATLGESFAEIELKVRTAVDGMPALVVDSFTVVEYRASCAFACPYLVYAPLLKLREVTGRGPARVVAVEFTIPGHSTGVCRGNVEFNAGSSAHLNGVDPYLWNNDLIFVEVNGAPVPDGPATARVWVEADGVTRVLNAAGTIRRSAQNPDLPPLISSWDC